MIGTPGWKYIVALITPTSTQLMSFDIVPAPLVFKAVITRTVMMLTILSFIRTRSLTSCQQPVCCGTLSNSKRGKQTHCCNVYFCPLPPEAENSTFSAKCGRRKFIQGTLFCKMECVLHSFLAYMVFLWVVSRTDPGISLKYRRPAGNKTNDI